MSGIRFFLCILLAFFAANHPLRAQEIERVKMHLKALCAPEMHGRGYVQTGDAVAAQYIAKAFLGAGLKPLKSNKRSFFQYFNFDINTFPARASLSFGGQDLKTGEDFIVHAASRSGTGQQLPLKSLSDSVLLSNDKTFLEKFLKEDLSQQAILISEAQYKLLSEGSKNHDLFRKVITAPALVVLAQKLTMTLSQEQYMPPTFIVLPVKMNVKASEISFTLDAKLIPSYRSQNVLGYLEGSSKSDSTVIFCAHYDHLGRLGTEAYFPGANDNAAGVAMLLELIHYYKSNKPKFRTVFIAFGAEEVGLIGSEHYVQNPLLPLSNIKFVLNLDLVGTGDRGVTVVNATILPKQFAQLQQINEQKNYLSKISARGPAANSDHYFFTLKEVPAFFFYLMGGIQAYHDVHDRAETLPLTEFKDFFELLKDFVKSL
ncbi:MAG: M20/M25/M40 family metallo-hydrolase [Cytophagales bacterium]|nr:MAG: M20/M25/M40 family metallo-hydrolase [Cytophagales bacterium]TAF62368.1 MAG: M20/M25/M40 family metallo-hydrolase [Cytophagales bacterium]